MPVCLKNTRKVDIESRCVTDIPSAGVCKKPHKRWISRADVLPILHSEIDIVDDLRSTIRPTEEDRRSISF